MREIKFRAWAKDSADRAPLIWDWNVYRKDIAEWLINCPPDVVLMQFTGLKDKHGKEIYEGDVLKNADGEIGKVVWAEKYCTDNEHNEDIMGWCVDTGLQYWALDPQGTYEIIGNIYQNPELLK